MTGVPPSQELLVNDQEQCCSIRDSFAQNESELQVESGRTTMDTSTYSFNFPRPRPNTEYHGNDDLHLQLLSPSFS